MILTYHFWHFYACHLPLPSINTQARTHTQIHIHAQIPAYVQLPTLFQPRVLSQPSAHLHCNQAPYSGMISVDPPFLAETLIITRRPCIISEDSNEAAAFYLSALHTLVARSQVYWKDHSPSPVSIYFLPLLLTHPCFNTSDPHPPCLLDPRSCDPSSSDYYSSMISLV